MRAPRAGLERCPLDELLPKAIERLRSASLDELAAIMLTQSNQMAPTAAVRIDTATRAWCERHRLSGAEADILRLAALGDDRAKIARIRGASPMTVKTQIRAMLKKMKVESFHVAVERLLREAMGD